MLTSFPSGMVGRPEGQNGTAPWKIRVQRRVSLRGHTDLQGGNTVAEHVEKNLSYVKRLAESTAVPVTFGLIPSAAEVWKDKLPDGAASWDQTDLLEESGVDFLTALSTHAGDQVFYRTDHHWTTLGAFYGANALLETWGIEPLRVEDFTPETASDSFNGTLYSQSGIHWLRPDSIEFWAKEDGLTVTSWRTGKPEPASLYDR